LPIYAAHLAWAIYLGLFYHRVFRHLQESRRARALSLATVLVIPPCAIAAMVLPETWVLSIAVCGMVIGLKMLTLGWTSDVNPAARERMRNMGRITTSNMVIAALIGTVVLGMSIVLVHGEPATQYWTIAMITFSTIFTIACFVLVHAHVGRQATGLTLGVLARPAEPIIPLPEA
jgi:Kef-type K+ transport system membrane component KefB